MAVFVNRYPVKRTKTVKIFSDVQALEIIDAIESLLCDPKDELRTIPARSSDRSDASFSRRKPGSLQHFWKPDPQFD